MKQPNQTLRLGIVTAGPALAALLIAAWTPSAAATSCVGGAFTPFGIGVTGQECWGEAQPSSTSVSNVYCYGGDGGAGGYGGNGGNGGSGTYVLSPDSGNGGNAGAGGNGGDGGSCYTDTR